MMLCTGVSCGTENLQLRLPLFSLYTQRKFLQFSSQSPSPPHTISTLYRHHHSFFSSFLASFTDLCRFPLFSLSSPTLNQQRGKKMLAGKQNFVQRSQPAPYTNFPNIFRRWIFFLPQSVPHSNSTFSGILFSYD